MTASFDACGDIPTGTTLLEASAGTGKTYTIAALATRIVAEGRAPLSQLMLVTFGRAATAELRERVREQLVRAHAALANPAAARADAEDAVVRLLATGSDDELSRRRQLLRVALSDFDAATIATTHGFCQQMLAALGIVGDSDPRETLSERTDDLVDEVLKDLWVRRFGITGAEPAPIPFRVARLISRSSVEDRHARPVPHEPNDPADPADPAEVRVRVRLAERVRAEVQARKRARRILDYDDLLTRLRDVLIHPLTGATACSRLRERYRYVLVDEFQDTDPVQWEILRTAFHDQPGTSLVLIGDPKQAIYAFRGADVHAYLAAADVATQQLDLGRNWRSDHDLLEALQALYGGAALGETSITVRPVQAHHASRRLAAPSCNAPLRLRVVPRNRFPLNNSELNGVGDVRPYVATDLAADIVRLLSSTAVLSTGPSPRPVAPRDIAVLVNRHTEATLVYDALRAADVPAVVTGLRSVYTTAAARDWLTLLRALEQPHRSGLVRGAAVTSFVGWDAARLATADADEVDDLGRRMREWRDVLATRGVAALLEVVTASERLTERLLAGPRGERLLTDLRHVGQTLHAAMQGEGVGAAALVGWLQRRISDAGEELTEERSRRLETDLEAVQVITIHTSKGLEFPVVYLPFAWDAAAGSRVPETFRLHGDDGERQLFVGGRRATAHRTAYSRSRTEAAGESLRLLYVGLTRAKCQVVTWWAATSNTERSPLHRLLLGPRAPGAVPPETVRTKGDPQVRAALEAWADGAGGQVALEEVGDASGRRWTPPGATGDELRTAQWDRALDRAWRRTSYSSLTAAAHDPAGVASEPETQERQDEPPVPQPDVAPTAEDTLRDVVSPMADLPAGAAFGTVVHAVLETVDTTAGDLAAELRQRSAQALGQRLATTLSADRLADGLLPVLRTPLGPLTGGRTLAEIDPRDRLVELDFELPLAGGDGVHDRRAGATLTAAAELVRRHLPASDPLVSYPDLLTNLPLAGQLLRGYLTGSIDAVLRVDGPRYVIVDYKTNWLGGHGAAGPLPLTAWDYRPSALATAMLHAHYPLQALLYSVALHRYLCWRQPSYDPSRHLGGVLYLFVRGMCGASTPATDGVPTGVFSWQPPPELVEELSALLDRLPS